MRREKPAADATLVGEEDGDEQIGEADPEAPLSQPDETVAQDENVDGEDNPQPVLVVAESRRSKRKRRNTVVSVSAQQPEENGSNEESTEAQQPRRSGRQRKAARVT